MEKFTSSLLNKFVNDKLSAKMVNDNIHVIEFVERQVAEFGLEKHTAFLEKVFHGKQVSAEHFFKVLTRVEAAIAKKAGTKVAKATKTAKPVAKATKKADNTWKAVAKATKGAITEVAKATKASTKVAKATKQASKPNAQKESVSTDRLTTSSLKTLQAEIAKLVKVYNETAKDGKPKIAVTMSYIVAQMQ